MSRLGSARPGGTNRGYGERGVGPGLFAALIGPALRSARNRPYEMSRPPCSKDCYTFPMTKPSSVGLSEACYAL